MSRRDQIRMSDDEIAAYLNEPRLCRIGTINPGGAVHLVAMNYGFVDGVPAFWSYRVAQKIRNLERDPNIGMIVDSGKLYSELKGVQIMGRGEIVNDVEAVYQLLDSMSARYGDVGSTARGSAPKRCVVKVHADKVISWDHAKLGGRY